MKAPFAILFCATQGEKYSDIGIEKYVTKKKFRRLIDDLMLLVPLHRTLGNTF
jgi:hypothetical protein